MKACPHCGKELPEEMRFCPYCMHKLIPEQTVIGTPSHRRRWGFLWIGGAAMFAVIVALLVWAIGWLSHQPLSSFHSTESSSLTDGGTGGALRLPSSVDAATGVTSPSVTDSEGASSASSADSGTGTTTASSPSSTAVPSKTGEKATGTTTASPTSPASGSTTTPCAGGHDWEAITETVQHEEEGHYESVITGYRSVTKYKCAICYKKFASLDSYYTHFDEHIASSDSLVIVLRDRYETVTESEPIYEEQWVVDKEAYTEQRVVGRRCRVCDVTE